MSAKRRPLSHGASHSPGGPDEIPGLGGGGDVVGDTSSVVGRIASFSGIDGKHIEDSGVDVTNVPSAGEKSALAGTAGTPGGGNKFVTEADVSSSPGAGRVPRADGSGLLDAWISTATTLVYGLVKLGVSGGAQVYSAILTAITSLSATGLIARTGSGTVAARTLTAGSARVTVTNGDGAAGDPTVDVAAASTSVAGVATLGAPGGSRTYTATTQTLSSSGTMDADVEQLRITASCPVQLREISTLTIARPTVVVVESTSEIVVELIADAADKIEGATRAYLVATRGLYILTPAVANKWTLAAVRGRALWLHAGVDLSSASGSSAWSVSGTTWTDTSSASSSFAAAAGGLTATAKSTSSYYGAASADCAMVRTPVSGLVDGWSRPMDPVRGRYWILTKWSRTTSVGGSSVIAYVAMGTATLAGTPRIGIRDETGGAVVDHITRDSATHTLTTIGTSTVSAGWMGFRWDGALLKVTGAVRSTSPSGNPGEASGWCPSTYDLGDYAQHGQDYWGTQWRPDNLTNIHLAQTNTTTGSKATFTYFSVLCEIGDPS